MNVNQIYDSRNAAAKPFSFSKVTRTPMNT